MLLSDASRGAFVPYITNYSSWNTSLDDDELSKVKFKDDGHSVEEEHKKDFYHIIHSSSFLPAKFLFLYYMLFGERGYFRLLYPIPLPLKWIALKATTYTD